MRPARLVSVEHSAESAGYGGAHLHFWLRIPCPCREFVAALDAEAKVGAAPITNPTTEAEARVLFDNLSRQSDEAVDYEW